MQLSKSNGLKTNLPDPIKLEQHGYATQEAVLISLKRAISRYSTLQADDGHWPGEFAGTLFLLPSLVVYFLFLIYQEQYFSYLLPSSYINTPSVKKYIKEHLHHYFSELNALIFLYKENTCVQVG